MKNIIISGAREGNLKNISLEIPKNKIVVFTGLSGCGKSTLAIDVIYQECQRQYLETMGYQGLQKPKVDSIENASHAIRIISGEYSKAPHSSIGTITNIYTDLRRLDEVIGNAEVMGTKLSDLPSLTLDELMKWIIALEKRLNEKEKKLSEAYILALKMKLRRLIDVGLPYLTLDRQAITLSGGEAKRVRLAAASDSQLSGIIYILDEPTVGLHPKDTAGLIEILKDICKLGNTLLIIEHDLDVMAAADHIIELGPGPGKHGGRVIATGSLSKLRNQNTSATGAYLRRRVHPQRIVRQSAGGKITVKNANLNNLKNLNVEFPTGCLTCVTGVSGSGKTTLIFDVLERAGLKSTSPKDGCNLVSGLEPFHQIISIEQSPSVGMSRSNVATYSGAYTEIRRIFSQLPQAVKKKFPSKYFSFNQKGGRCENCEGMGYVDSNMIFFENVQAICPVCDGKQFKEEVLEIKYHGYSIKDILDLSVEEAIEVFANQAKLLSILILLKDIGLGYLALGQSMISLSCGESQRLKLAKELLRNQGKQTLYLMDEPTAGLHPIDVENFLKMLEKIVDAGNTAILIEHNLQVINAADWIIDLGPGGGNQGGSVVAAGTPEQIKANPDSETGKQLLRERKRPSRKKMKTPPDPEPVIPDFVLDLL